MGGIKKIRTTEKKIKLNSLVFSGSLETKKGMDILDAVCESYNIPKSVQKSVSSIRSLVTENNVSAELLKFAQNIIPHHRDKVLDVGIAMSGIILNNIIVRIDLVLMTHSFCWTRLLRTTHVAKDRIRKVNQCVSASVKLSKLGEDKLPTCDKETIECILCAVFALVANSRDTIVDIGNQTIRDSDESMRPALLAREAEFMEVLDNIVVIFRDVGLFKRSPPRVVLSKDETFITLMIGNRLNA